MHAYVTLYKFPYTLMAVSKQTKFGFRRHSALQGEISPRVNRQPGNLPAKQIVYCLCGVEPLQLTEVWDIRNFSYSVNLLVIFV